jgi:hypothetical protein
MRRLTITAVAFAAAILLASIVSSSASSSSSGTTMTVVQNRTSPTVVGNTITIADDLSSNGKKTGRDQTACMSVGPNGLGFLECYATHLLAGGQIESQAAVNSTKSKFTVAITGGTGQYRNARRTIDSTQITSTQHKLVFHISG